MAISPLVRARATAKTLCATPPRDPDLRRRMSAIAAYLPPEYRHGKQLAPGVSMRFVDSTVQMLRDGEEEDCFSLVEAVMLVEAARLRERNETVLRLINEVVAGAGIQSVLRVAGRLASEPFGPPAAATAAEPHSA